MAFVERLLLYFLSYSLLQSNTVVSLNEIDQTSPRLAQTAASHGGQFQHPSAGPETSTQEIPTLANLLQDDLESQPSESENENLEPIGQEEVESSIIPDSVGADNEPEDANRSQHSANFLTPVNPLWTDIPLEEFSPISPVPSEHLMETEPFHRPSQHAPGNPFVLDHGKKPTLEWSSSAIPTTPSEEGSSLSSPTRPSPSGNGEQTSFTVESELLASTPTIKVSSSVGQRIVVHPSTAGPASTAMVEQQTQTLPGINLDDNSLAAEVPEAPVIYNAEKDTGIALADPLQPMPSTEMATDVMDLLPVVPNSWNATPLHTTAQDTVISTPGSTPDSPAAGVASAWPMCDPETSGDCSPATTESTTEATADSGSYFLPCPPLFITLHADWNTAMADWRLAWEAHVYGVGAMFGGVSVIALLSLMCLPFRCPSGCRFFVVLDLLLISAGSSRAFSMFYDAYSYQERLPAFTALLLYDVTFPCLTSSLGVVFLLLSMRSRWQLSHSRYQHPCALAAIVFLHFFITMGAIIAVDLLHQFPFLLFVSRGVFVAWTAVLSVSFFIFYCLVKPNNLQLYELKCSVPSADYPQRCPFEDLEDWNRAAKTCLFSAMFGLISAGLQLYAMLYALGYGGSLVFTPWPWWAMQLGFRLCEVGMCAPLALVSVYPVFCSREISRFQCWTAFFCLSPGHVNMKAPILPNNCAWAESQHEKLMICETIARSDSEFLPLYALVGKRFSSGEDLNLMYHSNKSMDFGGSDFNLKDSYGSKASSFISVQLDSDSTVDFRPPSPINLRRSIDEALFGEALILKSLFHGPALSSSLSLNIKSAALPDCHAFKEKSSDRGLYRTSSCMEIETALTAEESAAHSSRQETTVSSPGQWRGGDSRSSSLYKLSLDGSSLVLCSSTEKTGYSSSFSFDAKAYKNLSQANLSRSSQAQGQYRALPPPSQESLDILGHRSMDLHEELMDVCRQIDTFSVSSETIDL
ncbi:proline-rich transmembrane protein 4 [Ambystoma mexicanum]|uniref:proline-rich transmembrane protein 4 n=1 Tax=Ambystoma mexicanum TaxID=8296 RepID=UPI0037E7B0FB